MGMWCFIKVKDKENLCRKYIVKTDCFETSHTIFLCDLICGWVETLTIENLLARCQKLNPLLEASPDRLVAHVTALLDGGRDDVERSLLSKDGCCVLRLKSKLVGVPFVFEFHLEEADGEHIYSQVMTPMLVTLLELRERQNSLIKIIKKKDAEIAEYKINGAELSRRNLETPVFDEHEFARKCLETPFSAEVVSDPREQLFTPSMQSLFADVLQKMDRSTARVASTEDGSATNNELRVTTTERLEASTTQLSATVTSTEGTTSCNAASGGSNGDVGVAEPGKMEVKPVDVGHLDMETRTEVKPPKKKKYNHKLLGL